MERKNTMTNRYIMIRESGKRKEEEEGGEERVSGRKGRGSAREAKRWEIEREHTFCKHYTFWTKIQNYLLKKKIQGIVHRDIFCLIIRRYIH